MDTGDTASRGVDRLSSEVIMMVYNQDLLLFGEPRARIEGFLFLLLLLQS